MSYVTSLVPSVFCCRAFHTEPVPRACAGEEQPAAAALAAAALAKAALAGVALIPVSRGGLCENTVLPLARDRGSGPCRCTSGPSWFISI